MFLKSELSKIKAPVYDYSVDTVIVNYLKDAVGRLVGPKSKILVTRPDSTFPHTVIGVKWESYAKYQCGFSQEFTQEELANPDALALSLRTFLSNLKEAVYNYDYTQ